MTDEQLAVHANNQVTHFKKVRKAIASKQSDESALTANGLSEPTTTEVIAAHDAIILNLYNTIPTEQDAIDSLADVDIV
jgi:hypothetical protein